MNSCSMSKPTNFRLQPLLSALLLPFLLFAIRQREGQCLERQQGSGDMIIFVLLKTMQLFLPQSKMIYLQSQKDESEMDVFSIGYTRLKTLGQKQVLKAVKEKGKSNFTVLIPINVPVNAVLESSSAAASKAHMSSFPYYFSEFTFSFVKEVFFSFIVTETACKAVAALLHISRYSLHCVWSNESRKYFLS